MIEDAPAAGEVEARRRELAAVEARAAERIDDHRRQAWDALQRAASAEARLQRQLRATAAERHQLDWQLRQLRDAALSAAIQLTRTQRAGMHATLRATQQEASHWLRDGAARFHRQLAGLDRLLQADPVPPHAAGLVDLLAAPDDTFIDHASRLLLGRPADAATLAREGQRLAERRASRFDILREMRGSPEGRHAMVQELDELLALERRSRLPVLGPLFYERAWQRRREALAALALGRLVAQAEAVASTPLAHLLAVASPTFRQLQATDATAAGSADGAPRDAADEVMAHALARQLDAAVQPMRPLPDHPLTAYYWVDHTAGLGFNSGIQRVVRGMARALLAQGVRLVPVKWDEAAARFYPPTAGELQHLAEWNGPPADAWAPWLDPILGRGADWLVVPELTTYLEDTNLHDVRRTAARAGLKVAGMLYDAIPWKLPAFYNAGARRKHARCMLELASLDLVLTISGVVRDDLLQFLAGSWPPEALDPARVVAVELPGEVSGLPRVTVPKEPPAADEPVRLLCVSSIEPRKNHLVLLEAFEMARARSHRPLELVLAGGGEEYHPELAASVRKAVAASGGAVRWEVSPSDARLRELYLSADCTVYPSLEEGFGLPIVESLWYARPCICRDRSAMAEVAAGGGCVMVDTADADALSQAILQLARDPGLRRQLALEGIARSFRTWTDYGTDVAALLARRTAGAEDSSPAQPPTSPLAAQLQRQVAAWQPAAHP